MKGQSAEAAAGRLPGDGSLPTDLAQLRRRLQAGERRFPGLRLPDEDGQNLDLHGCDLLGSCFRESRFGSPIWGAPGWPQA
ncbi:MAG: hypothetical protein RLZZ219_703 [Cyanobacteriota bacterium]|jgi:hypothetical protein